MAALSFQNQTSSVRHMKAALTQDKMVLLYEDTEGPDPC